MRTGLVIGLGAVAAVAVAGAIAISVTGSGSGAGKQDLLFPALTGKINDVATVVVTRKEDTTTIRQRDGAWVVAEKSDYPATFDRVRRLLLEIDNLRTLEARTSTPSLYPSLEVEDVTQPDAKSTQVTLKAANGQDLASVIVGKLQPGRGGAAGDGTYVRKTGDSQSWLAKGKITLEKGTVNWLDRTIANVARERVSKATIVHPDGEKLVVARAKPTDKDFKLVDAKIPAGQKIKSEWDVNQLGAPLETLEIEDVLPAAQVPLPARYSYAEIETFDGLWVRADIVDKESELWVRFQAKFNPPSGTPTEEETKEGKLKSPDDVKKEAEAIAARTAAWAYKLPDWKVDSLRKRLVGLIEEEKKDDKKS